MELTPEQLRQYLDVLQKGGVQYFEGLGFCVRFTPETAYQPAQAVEERPEPEPSSMWENPRLWPGGKPPKFPSNLDKK